MQIVSSNTEAVFEYDDRRAELISDVLTPVLCDMPPRERIAAMAMQIAFACWEELGEQHQVLDAVAAELMAEVTNHMTLACFRANRRPLPCDDECDTEGNEELGG